ncbi:MAG: L,D-transpeptidase [Endozoicomonas sp.]
MQSFSRFSLVKIRLLCLLGAASFLLSGCSSRKTLEVGTPLPRIEISVAEQNLTYYSHSGAHRTYPVSTARFGTGQADGSLQTPLGKHVIVEKVGDGLPWNAVFKYGAFTGKYYQPGQLHSSGDPILTRIIRLAGTEEGFNAGPGVDTEQRRIYIHGTPASEKPEEGVPRSRGCIRMSARHILDLYQHVSVGTEVIIKKH